LFVEMTFLGMLLPSKLDTVGVFLFKYSLLYQELLWLQFYNSASVLIF